MSTSTSVLFGWSEMVWMSVAGPLAAARCRSWCNACLLLNKRLCEYGLAKVEQDLRGCIARAMPLSVSPNGILTLWRAVSPMARSIYTFFFKWNSNSMTATRKVTSATTTRQDVNLPFSTKFGDRLKYVTCRCMGLPWSPSSKPQSRPRMFACLSTASSNSGW